MSIKVSQRNNNVLFGKLNFIRNQLKVFEEIIKGNALTVRRPSEDYLFISSYDANADDLFVRLGWQKLSLQRELKTATMVYKSLNGLAPDYLKSMFTDRSSTSTYSK